MIELIKFKKEDYHSVIQDLKAQLKVEEKLIAKLSKKFELQVKRYHLNYYRQLNNEDEDTLNQRMDLSGLKVKNAKKETMVEALTKKFIEEEEEMSKIGNSCFSISDDPLKIILEKVLRMEESDLARRAECRKMGKNTFSSFRLHSSLILETFDNLREFTTLRLVCKRWKSMVEEIFESVDYYFFVFSFSLNFDAATLLLSFTKHRKQVIEQSSTVIIHSLERGKNAKAKMIRDRAEEYLLLICKQPEFKDGIAQDYGYLLLEECANHMWEKGFETLLSFPEIDPSKDDDFLVKKVSCYAKKLLPILLKDDRIHPTEALARDVFLDPEDHWTRSTSVEAIVLLLVDRRVNEDNVHELTYYIPEHKLRNATRIIMSDYPEAMERLKLRPAKPIKKREKKPGDENKPKQKRRRRKYHSSDEDEDDSDE